MGFSRSARGMATGKARGTDGFVGYLGANGIELPASALFLSQRRVREARYFRIVDVRAHDRKTYDDQLPRIRRSNEVFAPMQQIVMDVKVIDCAVRRQDGSVGWPRMIAYMDTGTQRIFRRFFLLEAGMGIRQEHVVETFLDMVRDPLWGFPLQLYRDNGSEFFVFDLIRSALAQLQEERAPTIINARAYSAASKPIESKFATLDRFVFSQMQGWGGGDRLRKKTAHTGKPPEPYPGSFQEFVEEAEGRIREFESRPIGSGPFAGKSPHQLLDEHAAKGWQSVLIPPERLDAAFCTREKRTVSRGCLKIGGKSYRHCRLVTGRPVTVARPWRRDAHPLVYLEEAGWLRLKPDRPFAPTNLKGARASETRRRQHDAEVIRMKALAGKIDPHHNHLRRLAAVSREPTIAPIIDDQALPQQELLGAELMRSEPPPADAEMLRKAKRRMETDELERYLANEKP